MEFRSIGRRVIHREYFDIVPGRLCFGAFGVEARRGRHIEAFGRANSLRVVYQHKRRGPVVRVLNTRRPMSFVTENEIEWRGTFVLRLFDKAKRVIGTEGHRHRVRFRISQSL